MSSATVLSHNDRAVLGALFDPEASLSANSGVINKTPEQPREGDLACQISEQEAVRLLNTDNPSEQAVRDAIAKLRGIIEQHPSYASAYANRAQAYRLLPDSSSCPDNLRSILLDLEAAIETASPANPLAPISVADARVLSQAHTHRGYLFLRAATSPQHLENLVATNLPSLSGVLAPSRFEEMASRDFSIAGRYGNEVARQLAVKTNPYAKLCGQIIKEALQREITEYYGGSDESIRM